MRKAIYASAAVLLSCLGLALYWHWLFVFYPEHVATRFIGSEEHRTVNKRHSEHDWYLNVVLPTNQGEALLRNRVFHPGYDPNITLPKTPSPDIETCKACWSYYEGSGRGTYGYFVAVLASDKRNLQLYEVFGD